MKTRCLLLLFATLFAIATPAIGQIVWDESDDGPISSVSSAPTPIDLNVGSNLLFGSTTSSPLEPDFVVFDVPPNHTLDTISLTRYVTPQSLSFFAMQLGTGITSTTNPDALLGAALIGTGAGVAIGDDLLDDLAEAPLGGTGFEEALGPGTYTLWFQETGSPVDYGFDIVLVPEPTNLPALAVIGMLCLSASERKKRR